MLDPTLVPTRFKPVGITKGPGENAHEYTFVSRDDEQVLKNGEYVYYELAEPGNVGVPLAGTRTSRVSEPGNVAGTRSPQDHQRARLVGDEHNPRSSLGWGRWWAKKSLKAVNVEILPESWISAGEWHLCQSPNRWIPGENCWRRSSIAVGSASTL